MTRIYRNFWRIGGFIGTAAISFTAGAYSDRWISFEKANAATAVVPVTPPSLMDIPPQKTGTEMTISRIPKIMQFGYPSVDTVRPFDNFVLSYDRKNRTAQWVVEYLTKEDLKYAPTVDRTKSAFHEDQSMHPYFRATNADYLHSGYDRGHLAAAGNHRTSQSEIDGTFVLSNISPQVGKGFNRDKWNELEKRVRKLVRSNESVFICTGPLYLPRLEQDGNLYVKYKVIGKNNVAVPTHFFKVILIEYERGKFDVEAYVLPNTYIQDSVPLKEFMLPVNSIERSAGFLIFPKLPKNSVRYVNSKKASNIW